MLIPQYSLRRLMVITALVAVVCSIATYGLRGHAWAAAIVLTVGAFVVLMLVQAAAFGLLWLFSVIVSLGTKQGRSPFETAPTEVLVDESIGVESSEQPTP